MFNIWESTTEVWGRSSYFRKSRAEVFVQRQPSLLALSISVLSSVLTVLTTQYTHHKLGQPILKTLLSPDYLLHLNSYLTGSHNELIIATLKLFRAMSVFGGGYEKRAVLEGFSWENKVCSCPHSHLPSCDAGVRSFINCCPCGAGQRRLALLMFFSYQVCEFRLTIGFVARLKISSDIRTLYVLFILSFVDDSATSSVKSSFLEQRHDIFRSIFGGLDQDAYSLARRILEVAWTGIWLDPKIKKTAKVNVFGEATLYHVRRPALLAHVFTNE